MPEHPRPAGRQCSHTRYRLSCDEFDKLMRAVRSRCQLCGRTAAETGHGHLVVDHDPQVGDWAVRGVLCSACNLSIEYGRSEVAATARYLEDPWYQRVLDERGVAITPPEPPLGTTVRAGRRSWLRTDEGWQALDRYRGGLLSWKEFVRRFGPHNIA
ncbi:endonuclease domain-containing protein [Streptomyces sp. NPDC048331]|uniref:endonuclease domain-containing protein n=1 Tax=Streptomyces sp. NPDC048331 TaxID=3365534 RepID=UPI003713AE09